MGTLNNTESAPESAQTPNHSNDIDVAEHAVPERVALEREVLDPATDSDRLREIHEQFRETEDAVVDISNVESLRQASDAQLEKLLKDGSTPYEALHDILHIIQERESKPFPPADE